MKKKKKKERNGEKVREGGKGDRGRGEQRVTLVKTEKGRNP